MCGGSWKRLWQPGEELSPPGPKAAPRQGRAARRSLSEIVARKACCITTQRDLSPKEHCECAGKAERSEEVLAAEEWP